MLNWLVNRVVTRCLPAIREAVREELEAQTDSQRKLHRELVTEANDLLDKLTRRAAREGMRRVREAKELVGATPEQQQQLHLPPEQPAAPAMTKAELRQRFGHLLMARPRS